MSSELHHRIASAIPSIDAAKPDFTSTPTHMNQFPEPFTFSIPAAIVALPDLTLAERVVLTHLAKFPRCGNRKLARSTWMSNRGIEALLLRLCQRGQLLKVSVDGSRHLMVQGIAETHTECGKPHITKSHTPCGVMAGATAAAPVKTTAVAVKQTPLEVFLRLETIVADSCSRMGAWRYARKRYETCIERVSREEGLEPEHRAKLLADLRHSANYFFTLEHLVPAPRKMPANEILRLRSTLDRAPAAKLLEFRRRIESGAALLSPAQEVLALVRPDEAVSPSANPAPDIPCDRGDGQSEQLGT